MVQRLRTFFAVLLAAVPFVSSAAVPSRSDPQMLMMEPMPASSSHIPTQGKRSALVGKFNGSAFSSDALEIMFADGRSAIAAVQRIARDQRGAVQTWTGSFLDSPGSVLSLSRTNGVVAGFASYEGRTFEFAPIADGRHLLFEVDTARLPLRDEFETNHKDFITEGAAGSGMSADTTASTTAEPTATTTATTSIVVQDVLVYYTSAAATKWGTSTLESMIHSAVQTTNQAYQNSKAAVALRLVGLMKSPVNEASSMSAMVDALRNSSSVRSTRDQLGADMVVVVSQNSDMCGYARLWGSTAGWDAYAAVYSNCVSSKAFAHELGHLQWLDHNRENPTGSHAYDYSYGYRRCVSGGFADVMSYPCSGGTPINYFSNPRLTYNGYAIGVAYESDPSRAADAARSLNDTALKVAAYRPTKVTTSPVPSPMVPAAPTTLAASSIRYNRVKLAWSDKSGNESGFKVQRSRDGATYATIATLGSNAVAFSDSGVAPLTKYYYRVFAYNTAGNSAYSNVISVTTPGAPPTAPASLAAVNGGNGTATITWVDKSTNETRFDIRRRKWDSVTQTWASGVKVGTVGANVTRFVNSSGKGTFRYWVRAANSSGASSWVGPAQVTVTGG